jgi:pimeloyl-ACP methyl ester carboxylesterase
VLEFAEYGDPAGVPVVFQPGTPSTCRGGAVVHAAAVRHGVRLVSVSRPGYGESPSTPPGLASVATQVVRLADDLGLEGFGVWGLSGGGPYALAQAVVSPERVTGVVVTAGPAPTEGEGRDELAAEAAGMLEAFAGFDAESFLAQVPPGERFFRDHPELVDVFLDTVRRALATPDGHIRDGLSFADPWDVPLADITVPVDLVYGDADRMVPVVDGQRLAAALPHARLHLLPGAGHGTATFGSADLALELLTGKYVRNA